MLSMAARSSVQNEEIDKEVFRRFEVGCESASVSVDVLHSKTVACALYMPMEAPGNGLPPFHRPSRQILPICRCRASSAKGCVTAWQFHLRTLIGRLCNDVDIIIKLQRAAVLSSQQTLTM